MDEVLGRHNVAVGDWELQAGDEWKASLSKKLSDADGAIVIVGSAALTSNYVDTETLAMYARPDFRLVVLMLPTVTLMDLQSSPLSRLADPASTNSRGADRGSDRRERPLEHRRRQFQLPVANRRIRAERGSPASGAAL